MRDSESYNIIQDPNYVYTQYGTTTAPETFGPAPLPGSTAITTLNSLTGPTLEIDGNEAVTGYAFVPSGTTITLTLNSAAQVRTNLGLGTISTLNSPLPTANGGTGTTTPTGVYTPTLTNVANLDNSTAYQCQWMRIGDMVTVSGKVDVDPTAGASTQLGVSLPVASNLGAQEDCAGTAAASAIAGQSAAIRGDAANNRAEMVWVAVDTTNQPMYFQFTYQVI